MSPHAPAPLPFGLDRIGTLEGDWRSIADRLWRARMGWPGLVRGLAQTARERSMRRGEAVDTARFDLILLSLEQFEQQAVRSGAQYSGALSAVFALAGDERWRALANLHGARDRMMVGVESAYEALRTWLETDANEVYEQDRAWVRSTVGGMLVRQGRDEEGFQLRYESIEMLRRCPSGPELVFALMNLGATQSDLCNFITAQSLYEEALEVARSIEMSDSQTILAANLAAAKLELGDPEGALTVLETVTEQGESPYDRRSYALVMNLALNQLGQVESARVWLDRAMADPDRDFFSQLATLGLVCEFVQLRAESRLDEALSALRAIENDPALTSSHPNYLRLLSEAAELFAAREEWASAYAYERRHRDRYLLTQQLAARAEKLSMQARYDLYRSQVERDFERRKREEAENARSTVQSLNQNLRNRLGEIQSLQCALQEQVITDPLTCLFNRRLLNEVLPREIERAGRDGTALSFVILDVDAFKAVNDLYGHGLGDEVLRALASLLKESTRAADYCCRYGGEEFCVVFPGLSATIAGERIDSILTRFAELEFVLPNGGSLKGLGFSAGVAAYPVHANREETLLSLADGALLRAKRAGKRRVLVCEPALDRPGSVQP